MQVLTSSECNNLYVELFTYMVQVICKLDKLFIKEIEKCDFFFCTILHYYQ